MLENYCLDSITEDGLIYFLHENGQKFASVTTILKVVAQYKDRKTATRPQKREWIKPHILQSAAYIAAVNKTYNLKLRQSLIVIATPGWEAQVFMIDWEELKSYFRQWLSYVKFFWAVQMSINIQTGEPLKLVTAIAPDGNQSFKLLP